MKYPVKYFCAPGLRRYPFKIVDKGLRMFNEKVAIQKPISGDTGIKGVLLDFNCGLRLQIPKGNWHVSISDGASGVIFFDDDASQITLVSMEKFYVEWEIAIWRDGEPVFYHLFDPTSQRVHFIFAQPTLGDNIVMLPYVEAFRKQFDCEVSCKISAVFGDIVKNYYPEVKLKNDLPKDTYACYYFSGWMNLPIATVSDLRTMPPELFGQYILPTPKLKRLSKVIYTPTKPREISEPYVCIGVQASFTPKCWLAPGGWDEVVDYLKSLGYRVLCIDRDRKCSNYGMTVEMPRGAEDFSGNYTLQDRINQLAYADFFIGVSSGLSWLAWAVDIPVVMISGITEYWYEFDNPYRVSNSLVCHGCFNDMYIGCLKILDCMRYKDTDRMYECSKKISVRQVISTIERLIEDQKLTGGKIS